MMPPPSELDPPVLIMQPSAAVGGGGGQLTLIIGNTPGRKHTLCTQNSAKGKYIPLSSFVQSLPGCFLGGVVPPLLPTSLVQGCHPCLGPPFSQKEKCGIVRKGSYARLCVKAHHT